MKLIKNQQVMSGLGMFIGLVLVVIAIIIDFVLKNRDLINIAAACVSLGAALFTMSLIHFIICLVWRKNPKFRHSQDIAAKDERNILIGVKAAASANVTLLLFLWAAMIIFIALGEKIYVYLTLWGLIVIDSILFFVYYRYYNKRL